MGHDRDEQHDPHAPQQRLARQRRLAHLAQPVAVASSELAPKYSFRLPIMCASTYAISTIPLMAIAYFLPTAVE